MGILDAVLGKGKTDTGNDPMIGYDPYGSMSQPIDPQLFPLINAPSSGSPEIAQYTTDNEEVIQKFRAGLQGYKLEFNYNIETGKKEKEIVKFGERALNDEGVNELCRDLELYLSKPFILSNFPESDKTRIDVIMKVIWKTTSSKLIVNAQKYDLDKSRRPSIVREMVFIIYSNIMRSYEDGERPKLYGTQKQVMHTSINQPFNNMQPKRGIFGF